MNKVKTIVSCGKKKTMMKRKKKNTVLLFNLPGDQKFTVKNKHFGSIPFSV